MYLLVEIYIHCCAEKNKQTNKTGVMGSEWGRYGKYGDRESFKYIWKLLRGYQNVYSK